MGKRERKLTNEGLGADRFESLFDLVNYAIGVAQDKIESGRDTRVNTDIRNTAYQVLREIEEGKDLLEPTPKASCDDEHHEDAEGVVAEHDEEEAEEASEAEETSEAETAV